MKAIVILFDGKITSKSMEKDIVGTIASSLNNMIPSMKSISISVLDDESVSRTILKTVSKIDTDEMYVESFIRDAIEKSKIEEQTVSQWKFVQWVITEAIQKKHSRALNLLCTNEIASSVQSIINKYNAESFVIWLNHIKECLIYI